MELRVLKYFLAVAREENITSAANTLHISQPTLSKQLMDLEAELGVKLFERGKRKITLTDEGMLLRQHAQEIIELSYKTERAFKDLHADVKGDIYIGCGETQGMRIIIRAIKKLNQSYPNIVFHMYSGNDEDVSERLNKGLIDFGLFVGNTNLEKYDYIKLSIFDTWGLLMPKDHPLANNKTIKAKDLENITLLTSRQALENNELSGWLGESINKLKILSTHNLLFNATLMIDEGLGCAISIDGMYSNDRNLTFRPFEANLKADLVFAWKKYHVFSKPAQLFLNTLKEEL